MTNVSGSRRRHRYDRLREHAISYLSQNYCKAAIQQSLPGIIQRIALGEMPHAGGVLRALLGLRVVISPPITGRVSHPRAVRPAHPLVSEPIPPSPPATIRQSIFQPEEPSQPVVHGASLLVASGPYPPPTESTPAIDSSYIPPPSLISWGRTFSWGALPATSATRPAATAAVVGAEGDNASERLAAAAQLVIPATDAVPTEVPDGFPDGFPSEAKTKKKRGMKKNRKM